MKEPLYKVGDILRHKAIKDQANLCRLYVVYTMVENNGETDLVSYFCRMIGYPFFEDKLVKLVEHEVVPYDKEVL